MSEIGGHAIGTLSQGSRRMQTWLCDRDFVREVASLGSGMNRDSRGVTIYRSTALSTHDIQAMSQNKNFNSDSILIQGSALYRMMVGIVNIAPKAFW